MSQEAKRVVGELTKNFTVQRCDCFSTFYSAVEGCGAETFLSGLQRDQRWFCLLPFLFMEMECFSIPGQMAETLCLKRYPGFGAHTC